MNTKQCVSLLRHIIVLLLIIEFGSSISEVVLARNCIYQYTKYEIVPINVQQLQASSNIAVDLVFTMMEAYEIIAISLSVVHFFAILRLDHCGQLNFVCGALQLMLCMLEFICAHCITYLLNSFDFIIEEALSFLFDTSNQFNFSHPEAKKYTEMGEKGLFLAPFQLGWSIVAAGTEKNHEDIDYTQTNLQCCGLTGRRYWEMFIPRSCCAEEFSGQRCILAVAFSKGCLEDFHKFQGLASTARSDLIAFGIVTMCCGLIALYFSYVKSLRTHEDYKSDRSSDDEEGVY